MSCGPACFSGTPPVNAPSVTLTKSPLLKWQRSGGSAMVRSRFTLVSFVKSSISLSGMVTLQTFNSLTERLVPQPCMVFINWFTIYVSSLQAVVAGLSTRKYETKVQIFFNNPQLSSKKSDKLFKIILNFHVNNLHLFSTPMYCWFYEIATQKHKNCGCLVSTL